MSSVKILMYPLKTIGVQWAEWSERGPRRVHSGQPGLWASWKQTPLCGQKGCIWGKLLALTEGLPVGLGVSRCWALSDNPRSSWHLNPDWTFIPLSSRIPLRLIRKEHCDTQGGRLNDRPGHCRGHPACISVGWLTVRNPFIFSLASIFFLNVYSLLHTVLSCRICPILCGPMDCSTPDFPVLHCHLEFAETQIQSISDALQPSHPLLPPSSALNLAQHQGLFHEPALCIRWPTYRSSSFSFRLHPYLRW